MKINEIASVKDAALWGLDQLLHGIYVLAAVVPILLHPSIFGVAASGLVVLGIREVEQARKSSHGIKDFFRELVELDRFVDVAAGTLLAVAALWYWL